MPIEQNQEKMRAEINKIVDDIFERAREMIAQDVAVETAFRLAISWELEVVMLRNQLEFQKMLLNIGNDPTPVDRHKK